MTPGGSGGRPKGWARAEEPAGKGERFLVGGEEAGLKKV